MASWSLLHVCIFSGQEMTRNCCARERGTQEILLERKLGSKTEKGNLGSSHIFRGGPGGSETEVAVSGGVGEEGVGATF